MTAAPPPLADESRRRLVDYAKSLDCIHCGLCLTTCPTYQLSGRESASPRGRVHLMRAVGEGRLEPDADYREELDYCLVCRHCESVCPAGVQFGAMMEIARDALRAEGAGSWLERRLRGLGFGLLLVRRWALHASITALALAQRLGLVRLIAKLGGARGRALASLPPVPPHSERGALPERTPALAPERASVAMLVGCVMPELFGRVLRATARNLAAAGVASRRPADHVCCGALHAHNGELEQARALARTTIAAFDRLVDADGRPLPVVVDSAGCGAHMKEYERLLEHDPAWRERAAAFSARVRDASELLGEPESIERLRALLRPLAGLRITYDDPCHLCHGQGIRSQPRTLLDLVPGLERVELEASESCCGSAGIYSLLRPADSRAVLDKKLAALRASGAEVLVTANPGCHLQWLGGVRSAGLAVEVLHLSELLARSLGSMRPPASEP